MIKPIILENNIPRTVLSYKPSLNRPSPQILSYLKYSMNGLGALT